MKKCTGSGIETVVTAPIQVASKIFSAFSSVKTYFASAWDIFDVGNPDVMIGCHARNGCRVVLLEEGE